MRKKYYIGIDIAAKTLAVSVMKSVGEPEILSVEISNTETGIKSLFCALRKLKIKPEECWFCFEHTGHYDLLLSVILNEKDYTFSVVPALEIKSSQGVQRGKTDAADAKQIATYALVQTHKLKRSTLPGKTLLLLKELLSYRTFLVRNRTQLKNSIKSRKLLSKVIDNKWMLRDMEKGIEKYDQDIKKTENAMQQAIAGTALENNYKLALSVTGVGPITSVAMIVYTQNFTSFDNSRKFNSFAGIAPFKYESGSSIRGKTKVSNYANKWFKALLYNAANSAVLCDPELKAYYQQKAAQNKHHLAIINAVASKIVGRIFAVINRQSPFANIYALKMN
jgi:transposase